MDINNTTADEAINAICEAEATKTDARITALINKAAGRLNAL